MGISRKLFLSLGVLAGLVMAMAPLSAHANIIGVVTEGNQLTVNGFTITNNNNFAVTLTGLATSVVNPNFAGDATDFVTSSVFAGGTCLPLQQVLIAGAACTVNLTFSTPSADVGEPIDFGVSQITLDRIFNNGPVASLLFEIQVNDAPPVPEAGTATLVSLGLAALLVSYVARKHGVLRGQIHTGV